MIEAAISVLVVLVMLIAGLLGATLHERIDDSSPFGPIVGGCRS